MTLNRPASQTSATRLERIALIAILIAYAVLAVLYAGQTPDWQVPDEPAHYNYTRQIAEGGCCPVLEASDWDAAYLGQLTGSGFDPQHLDRLDTVQYEDHQPPLYYLIAGVIYRVAGGSLLALRLFSALLGMGVILLVYNITRTIASSRIVALSAAAFAAFVPQHIAMMAGANNDALAEVIVGAGILLTLWYLPPGEERPISYFGGHAPLIVMGLVMGLGFITKASTLLLGPVVMLAVLLRWRRDPQRRWRDLALAWALFLIPALLIGALWWARNINLYGWPDLMGLANHDAVVVGQPRTADWIADRGFATWFREGVQTTFHSFWGQFGWMGVPMPGWVYTVLTAFTLISYAGLVPLVVLKRRGGIRRQTWDAVVVLGAVFVLGILAFIYYNTSFVQFQGRYLFPAMSAFAAAFAGGWTGWTQLALALAGGEARAPWLKWAPAVVMWGLAGLSALALWRFVIPNLPAW